MLWTRAVPSPLALSSTASLDVIPDQSVPVCVSYSVFDNPDLSGKEITSGEAFTSYDVDFTVKVEATGLNPDTLYWFFFSDCTDPSNKSPIGSTRTFASPDSMKTFTYYSAKLSNK